jgi:DNA-binding SARP family transcriptional activator
MSCLTLSMLGPFQVSYDKQPALRFESCKAQALLAYIVSEGQKPHDRVHLAWLMWPDLKEEAALGNLRHALANLRHVLGDHVAHQPYIKLDRTKVQFDLSSNYLSDTAILGNLVERNRNGTADHDELAQAVSIYRGDFMEGLDLANCAEFEEWVSTRRAGFEWMLLTALQTLCHLCDRTHNYFELVRYARLMVQVEPWDEIAHQYLMKGLALTGHRGDAVRQYNECRKMLQTELRIEPGQATTAMCEDIVNGMVLSDQAISQSVISHVSDSAVCSQTITDCVTDWVVDSNHSVKYVRTGHD